MKTLLKQRMSFLELEEKSCTVCVFFAAVVDICFLAM